MAVTASDLHKMLSFFEGHPRLKFTVVFVSRASTLVMYAAYPLMLLAALLLGDFRWQAVAVPAVGFVVLSVVRGLLNLPRPYEKYEITPLYNKKTKGNSFPSRHTFSAFIIALTALLIFPVLGIVLLAVATVLGLSRVLCGVHFWWDVAVAVGFALGFAAIYLI